MEPPGGRSCWPLRTVRLVLRPLGPDDVAAFVAYRRDPEVARYQSWDATYDEAAGRGLVAAQPVSDLPAPGDWLQVGVHHRDGGALVGDVAVHTLAEQPRTYEVGVTLARVAQGRGLTTEALRRVVGLLVGEAGGHRVVARCDARNVAVARVLARVGMRHEGRAVEADWFKGRWTTLDTWAVLAREL